MSIRKSFESVGATIEGLRQSISLYAGNVRELTEGLAGLSDEEFIEAVVEDRASPSLVELLLSSARGVQGMAAESGDVIALADAIAALAEMVQARAAKIVKAGQR